MGLFDFLKHKELTEIALLKKEIESAKEKEERLSSEIVMLQSRCSELSQYEKIADIEREKEKTLSFIQEQNTKFEQDKQQHINEINSLESKITSLSEEVKQRESQIVELDETIGNGKLKISASDNNGIKSISYSWNDEEPTTIEATEEGQTLLETEIDIKRGKNTLKVTAVNVLDNEEKTEKIFEGVNKPIISVVKDGNKLIMKMTHDMGFKKIEFLVNDVTYIYDENFSGYDSTKAEIEYQFNLKEGENTVIIIATSMENTEEIYRGKCTYNP